MALVECVPNVSEGRRRSVVSACEHAIRGAGVALLDATADASHHRSVFTFAGSAATVASAVRALVETALASIDLREHHGEHPRVGAVDVVPFVPLGATAMADCVALARSVGRELAERHELPVFLYGEAAERPGRRRLEDIRRGGFERLAIKLAQPEWEPDFGPRWPHPTGGATVVGARRPLIAYNVNLASGDINVAVRIARAVRESSGGLASVKAMAVALADRELVQVSMNLTDFTRTSLTQAFRAVEAEAARAGVDVVESELVGLAPEAALSASIAAEVRLRDYSDSMMLEKRLRASGLL